MITKDKLLEYHAATGLKRWWLWVVLSFLVFGALLYAYWRYAKRREELDSLRVAVGALKMDTAKKEHALARETDRDKIIELVKTYNEQQHTIDLAERKLGEREKELANEFKQIKALESWKDLDEYNRRLR